jgi:tetratricopeptide (TPR) repeat protein
MLDALRATALALRGPRHRAGWAVLGPASEGALASLDHPDAETAAWAVLAAEAHLLLAADGAEHRGRIAAARARPGLPGELTQRLWLSEARSAVLRGEVGLAAAALAETGALAGELAIERALLACAVRRSAGDLEGAAALAAEAVDWAGGIRHLEAQAWVHVGETHLEAGALDAAEEALRRAVALAHTARCERTLGFAMGDLGRLWEARGDVAQALGWYDEALGLLKPVGAGRLAAWFEAARLRLQVRAGLTPAAHELEAVREEAWAAGDLEVALSVALDQARLLAAAGEEARARARAQAARWAAEAAGLGQLAAEAALLGGSSEGREASGGAVDRAWTEVPGLALAADLNWLRLADGTTVSLERRGAARRVLGALAEAGGATCGVFALVEAGWPGERMDPTSALQRLYTTIRSLRRLGLEEALRTVDGGYRLVGVVRAR